MIANEIVIARTNAEFLNQVYGTDYESFMRSRWSYSDDTWVWMVRFDEKIRQGWKNKIVSDTEIWEEYVWPDEPTYTNQVERKYRIVVEISKTPSGLREYHILGKYMFDFENSTLKKHILIKAD